MITQVTFTGVDERTDVQRLAEIQSKYPFAEFGILVSRSRQGKENRYPDLSILEKLAPLGLKLSCHVCGRLARDIIMAAGSGKRTGFTSFDDLYAYLNGNLEMFHRIQLNISGMKEMPATLLLRTTPGAPKFPAKVDCESQVSILYDGSGGEGKETEFVVKRTLTRTGYAGGLNADNIVERTAGLLGKRFLCNNRHWVDMESGVRTDDWFDLDKVEEVLRRIRPYVSSWSEENI
jgi:hypothetical protein